MPEIGLLGPVANRCAVHAPGFESLPLRHKKDTMRKITVKTEDVGYRGIENVVIEFANGDKLEVKAWDREHVSRMEYSVKLTKRGEETQTLA